MTIDELREACAFWQRCLRLMDWQVRVRVVSRLDLANTSAYGEITWLLHSKAASISIVDSADMAREDPQYDQERTLVHELLHLHLIAWETKDGTLEDTAQEQAIWAISHALVSLRHQQPTP